MNKQESFFSNVKLHNIPKVKEGLKDPDIDPSANSNEAIIYSYYASNQYMVDILWEDKRVKESLKQDDKSVYINILNTAFRHSICTKNIDKFKLLLKHPDFNSFKTYGLIGTSVIHENFKAFQILLNNSLCNPTDNKNSAIRYASNQKHKPFYEEVVTILWSIKGVRESLQYDDPELYKKLSREKTILNIKRF